MNCENSKPYNCFYISQRGVNYFKYKYTIENFSFRPEQTGEKIISPTFVVESKERLEWCLHIYPNGCNEEWKEYVSVFLVLLTPGKAKVKLCRFSILSDSENELNGRFNIEPHEIVKDESVGFPEFVKKDFLLDFLYCLMESDELTILCEAGIIDLKNENHGSLEIVDSKTENRDNPKTSINISIPQSKLSLDFGNMFDSPLFYDCVIKVGDNEIKVHKEVLAKRSPAFCDIFNGTSEESQTNIIEVKDFSIEAIREMLKYIYTDEVSDIQNMANEMFEIANKYELGRLIAISEQFLCNSLSIEILTLTLFLTENFS